MSRRAWQRLLAGLEGELPAAVDLRHRIHDPVLARGAATVFVGVGTPGEPGLHDPRFLPPDESVRSVARALLAGSCA